MSRSTPQEKRIRNKRKIRATVSGTETRPRLSVFRSNNFIYAQLIDDTKATTIVSSTDSTKKSGTKVEGAKAAGASIAKAAIAKGISAVVFDRNGFKYAGRIKAFADAAREAGLQF
jgi:large subunit ribosomal protein L18